jgi:hypothetical protein
VSRHLTRRPSHDRRVRGHQLANGRDIADLVMIEAIVTAISDERLIGFV